MLSMIWTILIGFIAGLIARAIKPGDDKLSLIWTAVLGVGGSFLAKYLGQYLGWFQEGGMMSFVGSVIGAMILLFAYGFYKQQSAKK
jgi:uncharacterized membrane protein YeaQ/YmgE (transglycosylase-associated protein family)